MAGVKFALLLGRVRGGVGVSEVAFFHRCLRMIAPSRREGDVWDPCCQMLTNLAIDDELVEQARRIGGHKTKKGAVTVALQEYIKRHRRAGILELEGQVPFWPGYDHKALRAKDRSS